MHYELELSPDLETFTYEGKVRIDIDVIEQAHDILIHSLDIEISSVYVQRPDSELKPQIPSSIT